MSFTRIVPFANSSPTPSKSPPSLRWSHRKIRRAISYRSSLMPTSGSSLDCGVRYRSEHEATPAATLIGGTVLLDGKVAIVSGVGPGLGRAICDALHREGATLVVGDIDAAAVKTVTG